ncbi:MAG: hypothetical protein Kow0025_01790 [Thermodesulfovibrionales bacterium]
MVRVTEALPLHYLHAQIGDRLALQGLDHHHGRMLPEKGALHKRPARGNPSGRELRQKRGG